MKQKSNIFKKTTGQKIVFAIVFVLFALYAITLIYPFIWAFLSSLKTHTEFIMNRFSFPKNWIFRNYVDAFVQLQVNGNNMIVMLLNSLWLTVGGTLISVASSTVLAYVVNKYKFPGRNLIYAISLIVMILPIVGSLPAAYRLLNQLRLTDSVFLLLTYTGGFGFNFIVMYGFFSNLSWSYAEASFVDGGSDFYTFVRVMLPQARPAIFALMIIAAIGVWNDYNTPLLYLPHFPTIAVGIYQFELNIIYGGSYPILFAGMLLSMLPVLILFIFFQDTIMGNMSVGGLKG